MSFRFEGFLFCYLSLLNFLDQGLKMAVRNPHKSYEQVGRAFDVIKRIFMRW